MRVMIEKRKSVVWIVIFLLIVVSPHFTYFVLGRYVDSQNYENRNKVSKPVFTWENRETFPEEYENYYNDAIPFRNQLIQLNNSLDYFLFHQSSSERVVIGKNGWLFYCDDGDGNPVEQSLGYWKFTEEQLQTIADNLMAAKSVLESKGITFVLFIAPNKETIYKEELPRYYEVRDSYTCTDQLVDYLMKNTDIRLVYPKQDLLSAKRENPDILLYYKLDTHWNPAGAYIGAKSFAEELGIEIPPLGGVSMEKILYSIGDLANMLGIKIKNGSVDYRISGVSELETVNEKCDFDTEFIYHPAGADFRRLFVVRDSFSSALAPILATQFADSMWVHRGSFTQEQIFEYGADIFVLEMVERRINTLTGFKIS